ncbi:MAG: hypothetical protein ACLTDX_07970 [[Clostridium] innocuum]
MHEDGFDAVVVYADLEHGSNFEYLCGFLPRFEEALLILHANGKAFMVLGNENLNKAGKARIEAVSYSHAAFLPAESADADREKCCANTGILRVGRCRKNRIDRMEEFYQPCGG